MNNTSAKLSVAENYFNLGVEVIRNGHSFCFSSLYDWLRKRPPPHQLPIRYKTKTQSKLGRPRFPALQTVCLLLLRALIDSGNILLCFRWLLKLQVVLV